MPSRINAPDFHLAATLECGQAFRWQRDAEGWYTGIVRGRILRIRQIGDSLEGDIDRHYFALDQSLPDIVSTFPSDPFLQAAVKNHWGLRVLRQEPWETLASFIASSAKQIIQIRQIVAALARLLGDRGAFPPASAVAGASLQQLLECKLGFRAGFLLSAAQAVDSGALDLAALPHMELGRAQEELMKLPGVGPKIANCVLLFSCGHDAAFPVDVWVARALRRVRGRPQFGPYAGWAQQYLFFNERQAAQASSTVASPPSAAQTPPVSDAASVGYRCEP